MNNSLFLNILSLYAGCFVNINFIVFYSLSSLYSNEAFNFFFLL